MRRRLVWVIVGMLLVGIPWAAVSLRGPGVPVPSEVREQLKESGFTELELTPWEIIRSGSPEPAPEDAEPAALVRGGVDFEGPPVSVRSPSEPPGDGGDAGPHQMPCPEPGPTGRRPPPFRGPAYHAIRPDDLAGDCTVELYRDGQGRAWTRLWWSGKARQTDLLGNTSEVERGPELAKVEAAQATKREIERPPAKFWRIEAAAGLWADDLEPIGQARLITRSTLTLLEVTEDRIQGTLSWRMPWRGRVLRQGPWVGYRRVRREFDQHDIWESDYLAGWAWAWGPGKR